jgi:hypothetical protein
MSTERFMAHFKMPKKELNRIRKEYADAQDLKSSAPQRTGDELKNFTEMATTVFDFFEGLTGKSVNRDLMQDHLFYWFDEGYEPVEMASYMAAQAKTDYYVNSPEWFTIAQLFPFKDPERVKIVWDFLSHHQAQKKKNVEVASGRQFIDRRCGHTRFCSDYEKACGECLLSGDLNETCRFPRDERIPQELKEFAQQFIRVGDETLLEYQERVGPTMRQIFKDSLNKESKP